MPSKQILFSLVLTLFAISGTTTMAHPGHGETDGQSIAHFLLEPEHLIPALAALAAVATLLIWRRKRSF